MRPHRRKPFHGLLDAPRLRNSGGHQRKLRLQWASRRPAAAPRHASASFVIGVAVSSCSGVPIWVRQCNSPSQRRKGEGDTTRQTGQTRPLPTAEASEEHQRGRQKRTPTDENNKRAHGTPTKQQQQQAPPRTDNNDRTAKPPRSPARKPAGREPAGGTTGTTQQHPTCRLPRQGGGPCLLN